MEQYCLYLRKSRSDIEAERTLSAEDVEAETLARHEKTLLGVAKKMNLTVTHIFREVVSGETIAARPVVQEMLQQIEQGIWAGVLVMEVERLARGDSIDQGIIARTFKFSGTKIITPLKVYDPNNEFDEEYFEFGLFMSRREYKIINRRLQQGRLAAVKEGRYLGSIAPYGYKKVRLNNGRACSLAPVPEQAEIVKYIFNLYVNGEPDKNGVVKPIGCTLIANKLNAMNIPPAKSSFWTANTIRDILSNPVYIGKIRWNWRKTKKSVVNGEIKRSRPKSKPDNCLLYDGMHPAIVSEDIFWKAQHKEKAISPVKLSREIKNPLSGLLYCGVCGHAMIRKPATPNGKASFDAYICNTKSCNNVSSAIPPVERRVLSALKEWSGRLKAEIAAPHSNDDVPSIKMSALQAINKELDTITAQQKKAYDLLEQGVYTLEVFTERQSTLGERRAKCLAEKEKIEKEIEKRELQKMTKYELIPKIDRLLEVYNVIETPAEKNIYLKEIIKKIVYKKAKRGTRTNYNPDDFEIDLYPNLPEFNCQKNYRYST